VKPPPDAVDPDADSGAALDELATDSAAPSWDDVQPAAAIAAASRITGNFRNLRGLTSDRRSREFHVRISIWT
jgi:hypothetical protein